MRIIIFVIIIVMVVVNIVDMISIVFGIVAAVIAVFTVLEVVVFNNSVGSRFHVGAVESTQQTGEYMHNKRFDGWYRSTEYADMCFKNRVVGDVYHDPYFDTPGGKMRLISDFHNYITNTHLSSGSPAVVWEYKGLTSQINAFTNFRYKIMKPQNTRNTNKSTDTHNSANDDPLPYR